MKTIGYVSEWNPYTDRHAWSGTIFKMRESIGKAGYEVVWIPIKENYLFSVFNWLGEKICNRLLGGMWIQTKPYFFLQSRRISRSAANACDYLFFPIDGQIMSYLKVTPPVISHSDATFHAMLGYYWKNLPKWNIRHGEAMEQGMFDHSAVVLRSSQWAADSAVNDYCCCRDKVEVLEFGANIDSKDIIRTKAYKRGETFNVLFSGVEWERKGADIAIDTVRLLNEHGIDARLFLVGIKPEDIPIPYRNLSYVEYPGFLNKNNEGQYAEYVRIMGMCHCLLLPTHAECSAIVNCEASAFGLPIFIYDTGGVSNYVVNGVNGYRLSPECGARDFSMAMENCMNNDEFSNLREGALRMYEERLSWESWSLGFRKLMERHFPD